MELLNKSWKIDLDRIDEGYLYSDMTVVAKDRNEAKNLLLNEFRYEIKIDNKDATYLTIPVVRNENGDLFEFEGTARTLFQIEEIKKERLRTTYLDSILSDPKITHCYIKKRGDYYRPDCCGYTQWISRAGVYTKEKAVREAKFCDIVSAVPIDVEEHNALIKQEIEELQTRIINI